MDLVQLSASLDAKKNDLERRLRKVARHTRHRDEPLPQDFAEQAQELENEEVLYSGIPRNASSRGCEATC